MIRRERRYKVRVKRVLVQEYEATVYDGAYDGEFMILEEVKQQALKYCTTPGNPEWKTVGVASITAEAVHEY